MSVRPVTAAMAVQIIERLGYPPISDTPEKSKALIRKWAERHEIKKLGMNEHGAMRYDLVGILARVLHGEDAAA